MLATPSTVPDLGNYVPRNVGTMTVNVLDGVMENDLNSRSSPERCGNLGPGVGVGGWVSLPSVAASSQPPMHDKGSRTPSCRL